MTFPPTTERTPAIAVHDLSLTIGSHRILTSIDLSVRTGELLAIIGPSGSGKTCFLQSLNRLIDLIPHSRLSGGICIGGENVLAAGTDVVRLRRRVGMILQKPTVFSLSIRRNIEFPLEQHGLRQKSQNGATVERVLRDVGLWEEVCDRLDRPATTLSGGQKQRLCIARALALDPEVLLLDEPCSSLDPLSTEKIEQLLFRLRDSLTMVVVTHHLAQARRIADAVAVFWQDAGVGRLIEHGNCQQIFENPGHPITASYVSGRAG